MIAVRPLIDEIHWSKYSTQQQRSLKRWHFMWWKLRRFSTIGPAHMIIKSSVEGGVLESRQFSSMLQYSQIEGMFGLGKGRCIWSSVPSVYSLTLWPTAIPQSLRVLSSCSSDFLINLAGYADVFVTQNVNLIGCWIWVAVIGIWLSHHWVAA